MKRVFWILLSILLAFGGNAQNSSKVKDLEKRRLSMLKEIETTTTLLNSTSKDAKSQLSRINLLIKQIDTRNAVILILNDEVKVIEKEIVALASEIEKLQREYEDKQQQYGKALRTMQTRRSSQDKILFVLSAESLSQSFRRLRYLKEYSVWQRLQAQGIKEKQLELGKKRQELEQTKASKAKLLAQREEEASNLKKEEKEKQESLKGLQKQEKTLRTQLANQKKKANELNRQIEKQIALEIEAAEKARKAEGAGSERKSATAGGYAMTEQERKLSGSFEKNQGILPFPVSGSSTIVGRFGQQQHRELRHVQTNSNGIDIQTLKGAEAKSVFNGVVTKVFAVQGYCSAVIVRHGNYLTIYSNLDKVYVKANDKVSTGQAIGHIFADEEQGGSSILHFEIWKERTKLDPQQWIKR